MMSLQIDAINIEDLSPMMQQYVGEKRKRPDCVLFFRLGDFYELFFDDAILVSKELELTLTSRDCGLQSRAPMAGVPHHAAETYITRLVDKGYKIAICEQMEDPALAKGIVRREVVKIITPGTAMGQGQTDEKQNHYLVSVFQIGKSYGLAALDLSTGDFSATSLITGVSWVHVYDEIHRLKPAEVLANDAFLHSKLKTVLEEEHFYLTKLEDEHFGTARYKEYFDETPLNQDLLQAAASGLLYYVEDTQKQLPSHIKPLNVYELNHYMKIGASARTNLELSETIRERKKRGSLLWVLDQCKTAMGSRMLRRWLEQPLLHPVEIMERQKSVEAMVENFILRQELRDVLQGMNDIERLLSKLSMGQMNARELDALRLSLAKVPATKTLLENSTNTQLLQLAKQLDTLEDLVETLTHGLGDNLPILLHEGGLIREGFNEEVDYYREILAKGSTWILELEKQEKEKHNIKNLKVGFNKVFGYYIEVSKSNLNLVPEHYTRKQTLANAERYILPELKEMEEKILHAEKNLLEKEYELFVELRALAKEKEKHIAQNAHVLAELDCYLSLGEVADRNQYVKPEVVLEPILDIEQGRHPVVEKVLPNGAFVSNDAYLDVDASRMIILTGPNMSGKSTYMRQIAQICIMAQIGSFVPATRATVGICDQIFTRIGASDDLASGQSTFMVEMNEVAYILNHATSQSLLILDEIGRGTSTYDGLSIAWAVVEHVANKRILGARTLFATHYHELTDLEGVVTGVKNYHVEVKKRDGEEEIQFLHKIAPGAADESYGVEVARLAGVNLAVVDRANEILYKLELEGQGQARHKQRKDQKIMEGQMDLFSSSLALRAHDDLIETLKNLDVQNMTPLDALRELYDLSMQAKKIEKHKGDAHV